MLRPVLREVGVGERLDHPHIVKLLKPVRKSRVYIVMEYVEGVSLRAGLERPLVAPPSSRMAGLRRILPMVLFWVSLLAGIVFLVWLSVHFPANPRGHPRSGHELRK